MIVKTPSPTLFPRPFFPPQVMAMEKNGFLRGRRQRRSGAGEPEEEKLCGRRKIHSPRGHLKSGHFTKGFLFSSFSIESFDKSGSSMANGKTFDPSRGPSFPRQNGLTDRSKGRRRRGPGGWRRTGGSSVPAESLKVML